MSILDQIADFLSQFRIFNPHRIHGFASGPVRSHFWFDLGWAYKDLHGRLRDPARSTPEGVLSYLYGLQYYEILRVATYWHFQDAVTVGDQLRRACERVRSDSKRPRYIHQDRAFEAECKTMIESATNTAANAVMEKFEKSLNDDLKQARWETSYGHG